MDWEITILIAMWLAYGAFVLWWFLPRRRRR